MIPVFYLKNSKSEKRSPRPPLWGYIDARGQIVIEPKYRTACFFSCNLAYVRDQQNQVGFIDEEGTWRIKPQYFDSLGFWDHLASVALVKKSDQTLKWGVIDRTGKVVVEFLFDFIGPFIDGLARAQISGKWGYIDPKGGWVIKPIYDWAGDLVEGIARVQMVSPMLHTSYIRINDQLKKSYPLDIQNNSTLTHGEDYSDGVAAVKRDNLWGYIDQEGRWILPPQFLEAGDYSDNRMPVLTQVGWRLCDRRGVFHSKPYEQLESLSYGLSRFLRDQKWGFIDANGVEVISEKFQEISDLCNGYALGIHEGQFVVINAKGDLLWTDGAF